MQEYTRLYYTRQPGTSPPSPQAALGATRWQGCGGSGPRTPHPLLHWAGGRAATGKQKKLRPMSERPFNKASGRMDTITESSLTDTGENGGTFSLTEASVPELRGDECAPLPPTNPLLLVSLLWATRIRIQPHVATPICRSSPTSQAIRAHRRCVLCSDVLETEVPLHLWYQYASQSLSEMDLHKLRVNPRLPPPPPHPHPHPHPDSLPFLVTSARFINLTERVPYKHRRSANKQRS